MQFWPGPLTVVVRAAAAGLLLASAGLSSIALRVPNHPWRLAYSVVDRPVVAPSANFKASEPTTADGAGWGKKVAVSS